ncbi:transposase [Roseovarius gahaiensis]|uniref:Transposase n=1 Tax=Roseovarius gahaiensis TaxID=2716691 RepID=A0A967BBR9_9RHOB|nr:transposase [Roseovarius gahaiensis]NHQ75060.1 transposase [Roseovarius gahaiensis]
MPVSKPRFTFSDISRRTATEADAIAFAERLRWREGIRVIASHGQTDIGLAARALVKTVGTFMTEALPAYSVLGTHRRSVTHSTKEFARTDADGTSVHVNTAESCHADLRRMVLGVHHWISRKHLDRYLGDLAFRRSLRESDLLARLGAALTSPGRRIIP